MAAEFSRIKDGATHELDEHRGIKAFITKFMKDNVGMLAGFVAWNLLTSIVPIMVGLVFISSLFLRSPSAQAAVISHLHQALQGAISTATIKAMVKGSVQHSGLLAIIGIAGALWGGSNVGGAFSTAFQGIFEVNGRNFFKEKIIDIVMIFVFTALMLVILAATSAGAILTKLFHNFPLSGASSFVIGTAVSLLAAFLLFCAIYLAFPNIQPRLRLANVWRGAILSAVLFQILTYIWPIYAHFSHFGRYGALLSSLLVLTAWIYFFSMIVMIGAEVVAISAIHEAQARGEEVGPPTQDSLPQHRVLRQGAPKSADNAV